MIGGRWSEHTAYENWSLAKAHSIGNRNRLQLMCLFLVRIRSRRKVRCATHILFFCASFFHRTAISLRCFGLRRTQTIRRKEVSSLQWHTRSVYAENLSCAHFHIRLFRIDFRTNEFLIHLPSSEIDSVWCRVIQERFSQEVFVNKNKIILIRCHSNEFLSNVW